MKVKLGVLIGGLFLASTAFGQNTGGMRANDQPATVDARMTNTPATAVVVVGAHGDADWSAVHNTFVPYDQAIRLSEGRRYLESPMCFVDVAAAARANRARKQPETAR